MESYYFTFGHGQIALDGRDMNNKFVHVTADSYGTARHLFIEQIAIPEMGDPAK